MKLTATHLRRFNGVATLVWLALVIPTVLFWRESILWIAIMSVWANVAASFGAWASFRTEEKVEDSGQHSVS